MAAGKREGLQQSGGSEDNGHLLPSCPKQALPLTGGKGPGSRARLGDPLPGQPTSSRSFTQPWTECQLPGVWLSEAGALVN